MGRWGAWSIVGVAVLALCACGTSSAPSGPTPAASASSSHAPAFDPNAPLTLAPPFSLSTPLPLSERASSALALDLTRRTEMARDSWERPTRMQAVGGTFVVIAGDPGAPFDEAVAITTRIHDALYAGSPSPLSHRPDQAIEIWVYSSAATYKRGLQSHTGSTSDPASFGFYEPAWRTIVVRTDTAGTGSIAHEAAHPLLDADAPLIPPPFQEGVAALFEVPVFTASGPHGAAHFRLRTLRDALVSSDPVRKGTVRLDSLFVWSPHDFYQAADTYLKYSVARESMRWLDSQGKLWPFWRTCRDAILEDPTCAESFKKVMGKTPTELTPDFLAWVLSADAEKVPR